METACTIYKTSSFIGKRWTLLVLLEIYKGNGKRRYSELKKGIPQITPKMLSARLKELEKEGLVSKRVDASTFPVKCEYELTRGGEEFVEIIKGMKEWTLKWKFRSKACMSADCRNCPMESCAH